MARGAAARRYAKALFQIAKEEGKVGELRSELADMATMVAQSPELRDVLLQPLQYVLAILTAGNGIAQRSRHPVKNGSLQQKTLDVFGLPGQHFIHQIIGNIAVITGECRDELGGRCRVARSAPCAFGRRKHSLEGQGGKL